jgi:SAM-dependent methyltransferase
MKKRLILKYIPKTIKDIIKKILFYYKFFIDYKRYSKIAKSDSRFKIKWKNRNPQLLDRSNDTPFDSHYTYHPAWAARIIAKNKPEKHIDFSSILNFSTMLSAFIPVEFYDYRPANIKLNNLIIKKADLLSLPFPDNSISSLSCMHTLEHIGLGRYGDTIDPQADLKAVEEIKRVATPNGNLLIVVPIGQPKICFNAHKIYSYKQIKSYFNNFKLKEFSLIPDNAKQVGMIINATEQ